MTRALSGKYSGGVSGADQRDLQPLPGDADGGADPQREAGAHRLPGQAGHAGHLHLSSGGQWHGHRHYGDLGVLSQGLPVGREEPLADQSPHGPVPPGGHHHPEFGDAGPEGHRAAGGRQPLSGADRGGRPAQARSSLPRPSTATAPDPRAPSSPRTARPFPPPCWRARCSAPPGGAIPARKTGRACSSRPMVAPSFWTRSTPWISPSRPRF